VAPQCSQLTSAAPSVGAAKRRGLALAARDRLGQMAQPEWTPCAEDPVDAGSSGEPVGSVRVDALIETAS
jgi:hypothetical protein